MDNTLLEIKIYGFLLCLIIFVYFLVTSLTLHGHVKVSICNYTLTENDNDTIDTIDYNNDSTLEYTLTTPKAKVAAEVYGEISLICRGNYDKEFCSFTSHLGKTYVLNNKYATDENGRIRAVDGSAKDCAIFIAAVKPIDEGNWHCNVTTKKYGGRHHVGHKRIQVKTFYRDELLNATFFEYE